MGARLALDDPRGLAGAWAYFSQCDEFIFREGKTSWGSGVAELGIVMKTAIIIIASVLGLCVVYVLAHLALIEVGREVVLVKEPTSSGGTRNARLWIVDEGRYSWIHPGNANAQWWVAHMDSYPIVEVERGGRARRYRARPDPESHGKVHALLRQKYGVADMWVRFLTGTDKKTGILSGKECTTTPVRLEPVNPP
jgi:hypothetical protein